MNISKLPAEKNVTEFSDKELLLWLKDYIDGWATKGVSPSVHYEAVKTELIRRSNEKIFNLTQKLYNLTIALVILTVILVILTLVFIFKSP